MKQRNRIVFDQPSSRRQGVGLTTGGDWRARASSESVVLAVAAALCIAGSPAWAGAGGVGGQPPLDIIHGGAGGSDSMGGAGATNDTNVGSFGGAGGNATPTGPTAGADGTSGVSGYPSGTGGAAGTPGSPDGVAGTAPPTFGFGGGGGGGAPVLTGVLSGNAAAVTGGSGGAGGFGFFAGGGGGGGAYGALLDPATTSFLNSGTITGGAGGAGGGASSQGGGGGGGGTAVYFAPASAASLFTNTSQLVGGNGGVGASGTGINNGTQPSGGGGGGGGNGVTLISGQLLNAASGSIVGGNGGVGGNNGTGDGGGPSPGQGGTGVGGTGGSGGNAVNVAGNGTIVTNLGSLQGGAGAGNGTAATGPVGVGGLGAAIAGNSNTLVNGGSISGGLAADGTTRANAVSIVGDANTLELRSGYSFAGLAVASGTGNVLALGGATSDSFAVTDIGAQYQGFQNYQKTGTSTWTLTGTTAAVTPWLISAGTLAIAADASLGDPSSALTVNGGTLQTTASIATGRSVVLGAAGGTLQQNAGTTLALSSPVSGTGSLTKSGAGTLLLTANNTYTGGTTIAAGTLQLGNGGTSGSILGNVANNGVLAFNRADAVSFAGAISGTGAVSQIGGGTTTLSGVNTYSGGTVISGGTLSGSATSFGSGAILDNAALVINQPTDATFANAINGTGSFTKAGGGTLNLTGASGLSGPTTVAAGVLAVNGSIGSSAVEVLSGAGVAGTGTVGSLVVRSGGFVAPGNGNAIGALTVNGNFLQQSGATYAVQDNPGSTASDLIRVGGTATLQSGAILNVAKVTPGEYTLNSRYTVLSAGGGVSGTYTVTGATSGAFYTLVDSYDANNVYLTPEQVRPFVNVAVTPNEVSTAGALQSLGDGSILKSAVAFLSNDAQARNAFNQLSGEVHPSLRTQLLQDSRFAREAALDRLRQAFCAADAGTDARISTRRVDGSDPNRPVACNPDGPVAWARALGSWGHIDGNGNAAKMDRSIGGLTGGIDAPVFDTWRLGVMLGYSRSNFDVNRRNSQGTSDNYDVGVYAGTQWGAVNLRLGAVYTWHDIDTNRYVAFPGYTDYLGGSYNARTAQAFAELGYRIDTGRVQLEPFANVAFVRQDTDGFRETGGPAALSVASDTASMTFSTIGVRASTTFDVAGAAWTGWGMVGWRHAFGSATQSALMRFDGSNPFVIAGLPITRDALAMELGVEAKITQALSLGVSYAGQIGKDAQDHGVRANVAWKF